jgi:NAD(P)-dependent dehydrogenase (short-subunit alcohol dehydrogenase family)
VLEAKNFPFVSSLAIVTGGSSGIGESVCGAFVRNGWQVVSLSRTRGCIGEVEYIEADLLKSDALLEISANVANRNRHRISLVHNAGQFLHDSACSVDEEYLDRAFKLMITAPARLNKLLDPYFSAGSSIIYVGSTLSEMAVSGAFTYSTMKHAVVGMMRATQQDFSGRLVHTCCVCPGVTATPMVSDNKAINNKFLQDRVSFGRLIDPDEIAKFIYYCSSTPIVNGSVLHANLGQINT